MQRRVGGHMYERQRCSEKFESLIPHFNYSEIVRGDWSLISFVHVPAKIHFGRWWTEGLGDNC